jgi:hypothetical protein
MPETYYRIVAPGGREVAHTTDASMAEWARIRDRIVYAETRGE